MNVIYEVAIKRVGVLSWKWHVLWKGDPGLVFRIGMESRGDSLTRHGAIRRARRKAAELTAEPIPWEPIDSEDARG